MAQKIDAKFALRFLDLLHAAVNAHDALAIASLCCENVVWEDPGAAETLRGRDAVCAFHHDILFKAFPDLSITLLDDPYLSLDGTGLAVRTRLSGTMLGPMSPPGFAPTGKRVEFETAEFSHFERDLLARHHVVLNMLDVARQIGAVPEPGSLGDRVGIWLQHVTAGSGRSLLPRR
jgi:predicted ester cyclase